MPREHEPYPPGPNRKKPISWMAAEFPASWVLIYVGHGRSGEYGYEWEATLRLGRVNVEWSYRSRQSRTFRNYEL